MRKFVMRVLVMLLLTVSVSFIVIAQATGLTPEQIVVFKSTYNSDGQFVMPVYLGAGGSVSANLTDASNNVVDSFTSLLVEAGTTITYKRSFAGVKPGVYYLNVKYIYASYYGLGEKQFTRKRKITHKGPNAKLEFVETYQTYSNDGDLIQFFQFNYFNANNKKMNFQIYDQYGNLLTKRNLLVKYVNGRCYFTWDYYPVNGGIMVQSDTYILKYWADGQTPKQIYFEVNLAEG
ncbi:MAG: hypothetical protein RR461_07870 [Angelakisella sp.]